MENSDNPVTLITAPNDMEAAAIVAALEAGGVKAQAVGGFTAGFKAEAPGVVEILVKQSEVEKAREILDNHPNDEEPIDWSKVDVGEPEDE